MYPNEIIAPLLAAWPTAPNPQIIISMAAMYGKPEACIRIMPDKNVPDNGNGDFKDSIICKFCSSMSYAWLSGAFLPDRDQDNGVSTRAMRVFVDIAERKGLESFSLHADSRIGGYAWAWMGFQPTYEPDWCHKVVPAVNCRLLPDEKGPCIKLSEECSAPPKMRNVRYNITDEEAAIIKAGPAKENPAAIYELANLDRVVGTVPVVGKDERREIKIGQALLCGTEYPATLSLDKESPGYQQFMHYTTERLQKLGENRGVSCERH